MALIAAYALTVAVSAAVAAPPEVTVAYVESKESIAKSFLFKYVLEENVDGPSILRGIGISNSVAENLPAKCERSTCACFSFPPIRKKSR